MAASICMKKEALLLPPLLLSLPRLITPAPAPLALSHTVSPSPLHPPPFAGTLTHYLAFSFPHFSTPPSLPPPPPAGALARTLAEAVNAKVLSVGSALWGLAVEDLLLKAVDSHTQVRLLLTALYKNAAPG